MKKLILKSIWNFIKFAIIITIAEICSITFFPLYGWISDFIENYAFEVHQIINTLLSITVLTLWAAKRRYIVFKKEDKAQNIISILFIIASVIWALLIFPIINLIMFSLAPVFYN